MTQPGGPKAVIFDLWETLVDWDQSAAAALAEQVGAIVGGDFRERWTDDARRFTSPIREALAAAGVPAELVDEVCALRLDYHRTQLVPRVGAVETIRRLRELDVLVGLITVCTEEVELIWSESAFAGLFDAEVLSSRERLAKPDPRIYHRCCDLLAVRPHEAVFVGDGANDELEGARRAGLEAILIQRSGAEPLWPEVRAWDGPRVTSIPQVLEVLALC